MRVCCVLSLVVRWATEALGDPMGHLAPEHLEISVSIAVVLVAGVPGGAGQGSSYAACQASINFHLATAGIGVDGGECAKLCYCSKFNVRLYH